MDKLVGSLTSDSTFTYQKTAKNTSFVDLLFSKGVVDSHYLHKVSHSFLKVVPNKRTSIAIGVAIIDNISQQSRWEDIHPEWYFLIQVPNQ
jgi:hypothetical protein